LTNEEKGGIGRAAQPLNSPFAGRRTVHIVVCLKQIIDPEIAPSEFQIDPVCKEQIRGKHALVISTFDEHALEVAVQAKEKTGGKVTALTIAGEEGSEALHTALAIGADEVVLLSDPTFSDTDSFGKTRILAAALHKLGEFDAVLCGRQAGDVELGVTGPFLAEELGLPCIALVANIEPDRDRVRLRRPVENGYEILEAPLPFVATVTNDESNVPRLPTVRAIRAAVRKAVPIWTAEEIGVEAGPEAAKIELQELFIPKREVRCEFIGGKSGQEKGENLALRLRELTLI